MSRFWPTFWWRESNIYLVFSMFISRPTSLLASITACVLFFTVYTLSPSRFASSAQARSGSLKQFPWRDRILEPVPQETASDCAWEIRRSSNEVGVPLHYHKVCSVQRQGHLPAHYLTKRFCPPFAIPPNRIVCMRSASHHPWQELYQGSGLRAPLNRVLYTSYRVLCAGQFHGNDVCIFLASLGKPAARWSPAAKIYGATNTETRHSDTSDLQSKL
jgi:hypothetical protein